MIELAGNLIVQDGKILLLYREDEEHWEVPGGKVEEDESPTSAAVREAQEEIGVEVELKKPFFSGEFQHDDELFLEEGDTETETGVITHSAMVELVFSPKGDQSNWYALAITNFVESDYDPADYISATLHLGYLMRRNLRFSCEYTHFFTDPDNTYGAVSLGFSSAF